MYSAYPKPSVKDVVGCLAKEGKKEAIKGPGARVKQEDAYSAKGGRQKGQGGQKKSQGVSQGNPVQYVRGPRDMCGIRESNRKDGMGEIILCRGW